MSDELKVEEIRGPIKKARARTAMTQDDKERLAELREIKKRSAVEKTNIITEIAEQDYDKISRGITKNILDSVKEKDRRIKELEEQLEKTTLTPKAPIKKTKRLPTPEPESSEDEEPAPVKETAPVKSKDLTPRELLPSPSIATTPPNYRSTLIRKPRFG